MCLYVPTGTLFFISMSSGLPEQKHFLLHIVSAVLSNNAVRNTSMHKSVVVGPALNGHTQSSLWEESGGEYPWVMVPVPRSILLMHGLDLFNRIVSEMCRYTGFISAIMYRTINKGHKASKECLMFRPVLWKFALS